MKKSDKNTVKNMRSKPSFVLLLGLVGVLINLLGSGIAGHFGLPLYLDSIGTVIAAVLGGALPGIIVGFVTNIIKSFSDSASMYYGTLNVLIAVCTAFFARRKYLRTLLGVVCFIVVLAFIGGGLGSILTWFLYGFASEGISASFARSLYEGGYVSMEYAQFISDFWIDLLDKTITVIIVVILIRLLPRNIRHYFRLDWWHQTPLSEEDRSQARKAKFRTMSLRTKILIVITAALIIVAAAGTTIGFILYQTTTIEEHKTLGEGVSALAASCIDPDMVDEYMAEGEDAPGYLETKEKLIRIKESSPNIEYLYIYQIDEEGCHVVFDLDSGDVEGELPGTLVPFDETFPFIQEVINGEEIEPVITDDSYGWLLTAYTPVYNDNGECVCYAAADILMAQLQRNGYSFLAKQISLFLGFFILILAVGVWLAEYHMILPMNTMALAAGAFAYNTEEERGENVEHIKNLKISTGDEIENLYNAFTKTTEESMQYVEDLNAKTEMLSKMQTGLIMILADMVENRDEDTGSHIKNTSAYCQIIADGLKEAGYYADQLTEDYIKDVVFSSPLHDIGKIAISDMILNKPGKLTDEEFEIMKTHTIAGGDIIKKAMATVSSDTSTYLREARNMAEFHHEKWNGRGYPHGLKGEDIPLSARIMAVADVFDALVSKRCYKDPFPFDKAIDILKEGAGEHFDPKIIEVFLGSLDKVQQVLNEKTGE